MSLGLRVLGIRGMYWNTGKENGSYFVGFRVWGSGV